MKRSLHIIKCLAIPLIVGGISGYITSDAIQIWYIALKKPSFNPPNYLFGPVWTLLYILMGVSKYLIDQTHDLRDLRKANIIYYTQLALNFFWSIIFFKLQSPLLALLEIIFLWICILYMIIHFYKMRRLPALINIPYLVWVTFASILTGSILTLN